MSQGTGTAAIIALPDGAYIKANKAYWKTQGGGTVLRYANRWIELPTSYSGKFTKQLGQFNPSILARCLAEDHGKLAKRDHHRRRQALRSHPRAGGVPGSILPAALDVAATGPAYPLRLTSTGPTLKGGKVDVCNDGKGGDLEGSLNFSTASTTHPRSKAPTNPVKLSTTTAAG